MNCRSKYFLRNQVSAQLQRVVVNVVKFKQSLSSSCYFNYKRREKRNLTFAFRYFFVFTRLRLEKRLRSFVEMVELNFRKAIK